MAEVKIGRGYQSSFDSIQNKDSDVIYICIDTGNIYVGSTPLFEQNAFTAVSISGKTITFTVHGPAGASSNTVSLSDFATTAEVAAAIATAVSSAYKAAGSLTASGIVSSLLVAANQGNVYNISEQFTTTADFVEGVGNTYPAGTNIVVIDVGSGTYKFDVLAGFVDLSGYKTKQTAVSDPTAQGEGVTFIDTMSQNANGEITATKKTVRGADSSHDGLMSSSQYTKLEGIAAGAQVNRLEGVQINESDLPIDGNKKVNIETKTAYNASTNKIATIADIGMGQGYGTCSTNSTTSGATMVVSLTGYELSANGLVAVKFDYTVPANAKLDINSQGAKNIRYNGANITAGVIQANNIAQFFYDGTYYHLVGIIPNIVNGTGAGAVMTRNATEATGANSFAEGSSTKAIGASSHAEGANGLVTGSYSHIEGGGVVTTLSVTGSASAKTYTTSSAHGLKIGDCVNYESKYRYVTAIPSTTSFTLNGYLSTSALSGATVNVYKHFVYNESSHVEGTQNVCIGKFSHVEGGVNSVMAQYGHAEGYKNIVYGSYAHAEGDQNYVNAIDGHVEGRSNYVLGTFAHAEGNVVLTGNAYTHAEGSGQRTSKSYTLSGEANATTYTTSAAHGLSIGDVLLLVGTTSGGTAINMTRYVTDIPSTTTLTLNSTIHETESVSGLSVTVVLGCSIGSQSHSEGYRCNAIGNYSHTEGGANKCFGIYGHIEGASNIAYGNYVHAEGYINTVNATDGHAEGGHTYCLGSDAHTEGTYTTTGGSSTHAEGVGARTAKSYTLSGDVQGTTYTTSAEHDLQVNDIIHVIGGSGCPRVIDSVRRVVAVPSTTSITLETKLAASNTSPTGTFDGMSVIKVYGVSLGSASHSEGRYCNAVGAYSHVEGQGTRAYNSVEHAEGNYNLSTLSSTDSSQTRHSVGIGTSNTDRKNAFEIKSNGDIYVFGAGGYDGTNYASSKTLQTVLNEASSQSDWNETDTTSPAYILNKPTIPTEVGNVSVIERVHVGSYGLVSKTLCAFNNKEELVSLVVYDPKTPQNLIPNSFDTFPIDHKVYYYDGEDIVGDTDIPSISLYSSYDNVDMRKMLFGSTEADKKAVIGETSNTDYVRSGSLFLSVSVSQYGWHIEYDSDNNFVFPYDRIVSGTYYLRIGSHNASSTTDTEWWSACLEDNNPIYYLEEDQYDTEQLVEYRAGHIKEIYDMIGDIETLLAAI